MLQDYIELLVMATPDIDEVWLIGSRANGTEREDSDWDLLVFSNESGLAQLRAERSLKRDDVDVLVIIDGDNFEEPWPLDYENRKSGSLTSWKWDRLSETEATYESSKFIPDESNEPWFKGLGKGEVKTVRGLLLWPNKRTIRTGRFGCNKGCSKTE